MRDLREIYRNVYRERSDEAMAVMFKEGIAFLKFNGFVEIIRAKRMVWGKDYLWCPSKIYSRIAGNLG